MSKSTYHPGVDLLRFFAAFWVMSFHYLNNLSGEITWYRYGNLGVPLFFIISGFVITQSISGRTIKEFAVNRFVRLFPLFWIACTVTYAFTLLMPNGKPVLFPEYLISMTMLGDKFGMALGYHGLVDPVYWSLAVELIFYTAIASFVSIFSLERIRWFLTGWLALSMVAFALHGEEYFVAKLFLVRHAAYFIFGATVALLVRGQYVRATAKAGDAALLVSSAVFATLISPLSLPPYFGPNPSDTLIVELLQPIFFFSFLVLLGLSPLLAPHKRSLTVIAVIGGITYPLYLLHQTIGNTLLNFTKDLAPKSVLVFLCMMLMIAVSYIVYRVDTRLRTAILLRIGFQTKKNDT